MILTPQEWLTTTGIVFFENKQNMRWDQILKQITGDPDSFEEVGGWGGFLNAEESSEVPACWGSRGVVV